MEKARANELFMQYKELIPDDKKVLLKNSLEKADEASYDAVAVTKTKNPTTTLLFSIFLGGFGVDRFYVGDVGLGVCKLIFGGLTFGLWWFIDIFKCHKKCKEKNLQNLLSAL